MKLLLRSPNWVGDAIMATPLAKAIKKRWPQCDLHILAKPWVAAVWENLPEVSTVIPLPSHGHGKLRSWLSTVKRLRQGRYDVVLILPHSFSAAWMAFWAAIPKRIGYRTQGRALLLSRGLSWTKALRQGSRPQSYLHLLSVLKVDPGTASAWGFAAAPSSHAQAAAETMLPATTGVRVGLAPGSVAPSRRWPWERYAQLTTLLQAQGVQVVLLGSPADLPLAEQVARQAGGEVIITAGKTDLDTGLAVIEKLDLVISNDSGAMHMAYAQQVPVLVLQGAADHRVTGPFGSQSVYIRNEQLSCAPCVKNECPLKNMQCMQTITVEQVWTQVQRLLPARA